MIFNMVGGGGGSSTKSTIIVSIDTGSTVGIYDSTYTTLIKSASEKTTGKYWLTGLANGTYYLKATKSGQTTTMPYTISEYGVYRIRMAYRTIPEFTYTGGTYEAVKDDDTLISDITTYNEPNWKIRFLTSGTLTFSNLYGAIDGIDVFLVGGGGAGSNPSAGGAGGGGGYTKTISNVTVSSNSSYSVTVGEGGAVGTKGVAIGANGGASSFGTLEPADGGYGGQNSTGGNGGSGGGGGNIGNPINDETVLRGGSDGGNGNPDSTLATGGTGQGTTTREFGESSGKLYAGGGGGGSNQGNPYYGGAGGTGGGGHGYGYKTKPATAGEPNTGGGGGAGANNTVNDTNAERRAAAGGSGIVIIRNARS